MPLCDPAPGRIVRCSLIQQETRLIEAQESSRALFVLAGAIVIDDGGTSWVAPAGHALAMVPGRALRITAVRTSDIGVTTVGDRGGVDCRLFRISPLLAAIVLHDDLEALGQHGRTLLLNEMRRAEPADHRVRMPDDLRARRVAQALVDDPADPRSLENFANQAGASRRTLLRLFVAQTGLSFRQFRRQVRIYRSLAMLAEGAAISDAALAVGYESTPAFIAAFRAVLGHTPGHHPKTPGPPLFR